MEDCLSIDPTIRKALIINGREDISFWTEQDNGGQCLYVAVRDNEPQRIALEDCFSPILDRVYFLCECGRRCFKLYLPHGRDAFKCRDCHGLRYRLQDINKNSMHGRAHYFDSRREKLTRQREAINTPLYRGRFTNRFQRFLRMSDRAGFKDVLNDARILMERLQNNISANI